MLSQFMYPIICTEKFAQTVAFYEDHFSYHVVMELEGYAIMQRADWDNMYLAIIDSTHEEIPEQYRRPISGMILSMPVHDVMAAHQEAYWEGLNVITEPANANCGRKHFYVEDPNGILITVAENVPLETVLSEDEIKEACLVA